MFTASQQWLVPYDWQKHGDKESGRKKCFFFFFLPVFLFRGSCSNMSGRKMGVNVNGSVLDYG
jgi:hypothetical protein